MTGVYIGQTTKVDGDKVRSGVTVILPRAPTDVQIPCYAGMHTLNGNGEVTGCYQIKDWGYINTVRLSYANLSFNYVILTSPDHYRWMGSLRHLLSAFNCSSMFHMDHIIICRLLYTPMYISDCPNMHIMTSSVAHCTHQLHFSWNSISRHLEPHARAS
jgi:hypothetical protein